MDLVHLINQKIDSKTQYKRQMSAIHIRHDEGKFRGKEVNLLGVFQKQTMIEGETRILTFLFTDDNCYYSTAVSLSNAVHDVVAIFEDDIKGKGLKCSVIEQPLKDNKSIYKIEVK